MTDKRKLELYEAMLGYIYGRFDDDEVIEELLDVGFTREEIKEELEI